MAKLVAACVVLACSTSTAWAIAPESPQERIDQRLAARAVQTLGASSFACLVGIERDGSAAVSLRITTRHALGAARRIRRTSKGAITTIEVVPRVFSQSRAHQAYEAAVSAMRAYPGALTKREIAGWPAKRGTCPPTVWIGVGIHEAEAINAAKAVQARYKTAVTVDVLNEQSPTTLP